MDLNARIQEAKERLREELTSATSKDLIAQVRNRYLTGKESTIMTSMKRYLTAICALALLCGPVSRTGAESSFYPKAKEEGQVLLYTSLAGSDIKAFRDAYYDLQSAIVCIVTLAKRAVEIHNMQPAGSGAQPTQRGLLRIIAV